MPPMLLLMLMALIGPDEPRWWSDAVETSIARGADRRDAWASLLRDAPIGRRDDLAYLLADLPARDLESLGPAALLANVELAARARAEVPWGPTLPEAIYRGAVLPHASLTEPREPMRAEFHDRYLPLVRECKAPGEAALKLNAALFRDYKVTYNTRRLRTDQSARESIAQGMATCTGLSIMLVEAARAVGIPARVAGIHSWPGRGGNHTWAEVWDGGWHFVGAAEPDPAGLDHAWFVGDAARAVADAPKNAIWAAAYAPTGATFPMVWAPGARVPAENVTRRYARADAPTTPRIMVEVTRGGRRVRAEVTARAVETGLRRLGGTSLGPEADVNLHLTAPATAGERLLVAARLGDRCAARLATVEGDTVVRLDLDAPAAEADAPAIAALLADRFAVEPARRDRAAALLADLPYSADAAATAWAAYKASPMHDDLRRAWEEKVVKTADRTAPFLWRSVGDPSAKSRALVIAMHGGGNAPKGVNDSQWRGMFERYYRDHPEAGHYVYLALRAPNDEWNGFYDDSIGPLIQRLILQSVLCAEVDPDRVYILGASHGGYGAFVIGPKIPDRFAAVHASAAAPSPGETMGENLRNVRFTFMVGEKDTAYGRADRCRAFAAEWEGWRRNHGGFAGGLEWKPGVGHSVPDRDKLDEMLRSGPRNPRPDKLIWVQSDDALRDQYWVEAARPVEGGRVEASAADNVVRLTLVKQGVVTLWLDAPLVDLARPITVEVAGRPSRSVTARPSLAIYCDGLERRGDPRLAAPVRLEIAP